MKNKKKIIVIVIIIILVAIAALAIYYCYRSNLKVEKLSLCKITTYDKKEITNYENNNRAFKIYSFNKNSKIKVNGKKYNQEGIYKPGEYTIEVDNGNKKEIAKIKINELEKEHRNEYDIYCINATYPLLLVSMDIVNNKNNEGLIWFSRYGTLDLEKVKEINPNLIFSKYLTEDTSKIDLDNVNTEIKSYVTKIMEEDKAAYFKLYIDEFLFWYEYPIFEELGITEDKYEVIMYSDGTLSYTAKYGITKEKSYDFFNEEKEKYEKILNELREGKYLNSLQDLKYLEPSEKGDRTEKLISQYDTNYILLSTLRENVSYYLQYPELITYQDEKVKNKMQKANIKKMTAIEKYKNLTQESKDAVNEILNLNKEEMGQKYFVGDKQKLVITGANPFYEAYTKEEFENMLEQVKKQYGKDYQLLYKPHPKSEPNEEQTEILNKFEIKILPAKLPMEAILFVYDDIKIGGFPSTLYMSTENTDTLFFFAKSKEKLVEPLNILYDSLFVKAKFIQPNNTRN